MILIIYNYKAKSLISDLKVLWKEQISFWSRAYFINISIISHDYIYICFHFDLCLLIRSLWKLLFQLYFFLFISCYCEFLVCKCCCCVCWISVEVCQSWTIKPVVCGSFVCYKWGFLPQLKAAILSLIFSLVTNEVWTIGRDNYVTRFTQPFRVT